MEPPALAPKAPFTNPSRSTNLALDAPSVGLGSGEGSLSWATGVGNVVDAARCHQGGRFCRGGAVATAFQSGVRPVVAQQSDAGQQITEAVHDALRNSSGRHAVPYGRHHRLLRD